jgi:hypothetical protein
MFQRPSRRASETASPVRISGVVFTSVASNPFDVPSDASHIEL